MGSTIAFAKRLVYGAARRSGLNAVLLRSNWRQRRLLILGYHGISLDDEHEWDRSLYMPSEMFRERLERIRESGCTVLPLGPAVEMLYKGALPPRAVAITFDDGFYDFHAKALPHLRHFGWPATVYLTTYYSDYNVPVFDVMLRYLLWKGRTRPLSWPDLDLAGIVLDEAGQTAATRRIAAVCVERRLSGRDKNAVLRSLAERLNVDLDGLIARRILHLMTPGEAAGLPAQGIDIQLHCHRHRVHRSRERFCAELTDNRACIERGEGPIPEHFCYPGGFRLPEFSDWLAEWGVRSAVTCELDLAGPQSDRFELPRLVDMSAVGPDEFCGWLSGMAAWVPRRPHPGDETQLVDH
ncbi:MAG TPA: polysaccharide deacetylase family protein [Bryobacteraceae bacterium]